MSKNNVRIEKSVIGTFLVVADTVSHGMDCILFESFNLSECLKYMAENDFKNAVENIINTLFQKIKEKQVGRFSSVVINMFSGVEFTVEMYSSVIGSYFKLIHGKYAIVLGISNDGKLIKKPLDSKLIYKMNCNIL